MNHIATRRVVFGGCQFQAGIRSQMAYTLDRPFAESLIADQLCSTGVLQGSCYDFRGAAEPGFMSTASGNSWYCPRFTARHTSDIESFRPIVYTINSPWGRNWLATSTAESSNPPGLLRKSIIKACIPLSKRKSTASESSSPVLLPNWEIRK